MNIALIELETYCFLYREKYLSDCHLYVQVCLMYACMHAKQTCQVRMGQTR